MDVSLCCWKEPTVQSAPGKCSRFALYQFFLLVGCWFSHIEACCNWEKRDCCSRPNFQCYLLGTSFFEIYQHLSPWAKILFENSDLDRKSWLLKIIRACSNYALIWENPLWLDMMARVPLNMRLILFNKTEALAGFTGISFEKTGTETRN